MKTRTCCRCHIEQPLSNFFKNKRKKDGHVAYCKNCSNKYSKNWYLKNKERLIKQQRIYQEKNKEKIQKRSKIYYLNNKEIINKKHLEYHYKTKIERSKKGREYYQKNKKKINEKNKEYCRIKYLFDINYKIRNNLRSRLRAALDGKTKSERTLVLLGCSIDYLKKHLEKQFTEGMSWDNHGSGRNGKGMKEWQIDHITPCASFDLSKEDEQHKCFHYTNLQPLWAEHNQKKNKF